MNNVICMKTRQILNLSVNKFLDQKEELRPLLERLSLSDYDPKHVKYCIAIQHSANPPYVGDCTHSIHKKRYPSQPFPFPNYNAAPKSVLGKGILDGTECDPFMHMDRKYKATYRIMSYAKIIYTRSDLVAHDDYIDQLDKNVIVYFIYKSKDSDINMINESGTPSYLRRLKACEKLQRLGFNAKMLTEDQAKKLKVS